MTTWNYRVLKKTCPHTRDVSYQIHEVYYQADGSIDCWNHTPVEPLGVTESGLRNDIRAFLSAFQFPVLEERFMNGKSFLTPQPSADKKDDLQRDYADRTARATNYLAQVLGHHLLVKSEPSVREAYLRVEQALSALQDVVDNKLYATES